MYDFHITVRSYSIGSVLALGSLVTADDGTSRGTRPAGAVHTSRLPVECEAALRHAAQAINSSTFTYSLERQYLHEAKGARLSKETGRCEMEDGKYYLRSERILKKNGEERRPMVTEVAFDGKVFYTGYPSFHSPLLTKSLGERIDDKKTETMSISVLYLDAIAFPLPPTVAELRHSRLDSSLLKAVENGKLLQQTLSGNLLTLEFEIPDQSILRAQALDLDEIAKSAFLSQPQNKDNSGEPKVLAEYRRLRSLEALRKVTFVLDRDKGYAVQSHADRTLDGKLIQSTDCNELEFFPSPQIWLPRLCVLRIYVSALEFLNDFSEGPQSTTRITLSEISFGEPKDHKTQLEYGPGSNIFDRSTRASKDERSGTVEYRVPVATDAAREIARAHALTSRFYLLVLANLLLLPCLGAYLLYRRFRRQK